MKGSTFRANARGGLSILEAIVATAIFVGALAILGQLLDLGLLATDINRMNTLALLRCESKIEEVVAGIEAPISTTTPTPYLDDPRWQWTMSVEPTEVAGLLRLTVRVEYLENALQTQTGEAVEEEPDEPDFSFQLTRLFINRWPGESSGRRRSGRRGRGRARTITIREMLGLDESAGREEEP